MKLSSLRLLVEGYDFSIWWRFFIPANPRIRLLKDFLNTKLAESGDSDISFADFHSYLEGRGVAVDTLFNDDYFNGQMRSNLMVFKRFNTPARALTPSPTPAPASASASASASLPSVAVAAAAVEASDKQVRAPTLDSLGVQPTGSPAAYGFETSVPTLASLPAPQPVTVAADSVFSDGAPAAPAPAAVFVQDVEVTATAPAAAGAGASAGAGLALASDATAEELAARFFASYKKVEIPGAVDLDTLATDLGLSSGALKQLRDLNTRAAGIFTEEDLKNLCERIMQHDLDPKTVEKFNAIQLAALCAKPALLEKAAAEYHKDLGKKSLNQASRNLLQATFSPLVLAAMSGSVAGMMTINNWAHVGKSEITAAPINLALVAAIRAVSPEAVEQALTMGAKPSSAAVDAAILSGSERMLTLIAAWKLAPSLNLLRKAVVEADKAMLNFILQCFSLYGCEIKDPSSALEILSLALNCKDKEIHESISNWFQELGAAYYSFESLKDLIAEQVSKKNLTVVRYLLSLLAYKGVDRSLADHAYIGKLFLKALQAGKPEMIILLGIHLPSLNLACVYFSFDAFKDYFTQLTAALTEEENELHLKAIEYGLKIIKEGMPADFAISLLLESIAKNNQGLVNVICAWLRSADQQYRTKSLLVETLDKVIPQFSAAGLKALLELIKLLPESEQSALRFAFNPVTSALHPAVETKDRTKIALMKGWCESLGLDLKAIDTALGQNALHVAAGAGDCALMDEIKAWGLAPDLKVLARALQSGERTAVLKALSYGVYLPVDAPADPTLKERLARAVASGPHAAEATKLFKEIHSRDFLQGHEDGATESRFETYRRARNALRDALASSALRSTALVATTEAAGAGAEVTAEAVAAAGAGAAASGMRTSV